MRPSDPEAPSVPERPKASQSVLEASRRLPKRPRASRRPPEGSQSVPERPRGLQTAPKASHIVPEASRRFPELPKTSRRLHDHGFTIPNLYRAWKSFARTEYRSDVMTRCISADTTTIPQFHRASTSQNVPAVSRSRLHDPEPLPSIKKFFICCAYV